MILLLKKEDIKCLLKIKFQSFIFINKNYYFYLISRYKKQIYLFILSIKIIFKLILLFIICDIS